MKRLWILVAVGLLLVAFVLGTLVGSRRRQRPGVSAAGAGRGATELPAATGSTGCVDINDVGPQVGKAGCVAGQVLRVYSSHSGNTFLDFCQDYRSCQFTSVIFASDRDKFGDLESLQGKRVEIRGSITVYQSHAEIIIHDPQQIRTAR